MKLMVKIGQTVCLLALLVLAIVAMSNAQTLLTFSKSFSPSTIGPGSTTQLTFSIFNNSSTNPASDVAFTDNMPAGVTIGTPANAISDCGGILSAPDGGGAISLTGGQIGTSSGCTITVNITSSTPGTHTNNAGFVTSSVGSSGSASADLTVDAGRPGFTKSFSPTTLSPGGKSTLTLTIDNTFNGQTAFNLAFSDALPGGMEIATPSNASTFCGGALSAGLADGGGTPISTITLQSGSVAANSSCTASVDVTASNAGTYVNTTGELTSGVLIPSGFASAVLNVQRGYLVKSFTDDPVPPGGTVTLDFTISNFDSLYSGRSIFGAFTSIAFTDDLGATLSGLEMTGVLSNECGGTVSGTGTISFSGGTLPPGQSCTISVSVDVPSGASTGTYTNTTSAITFNAGGDPVTGNFATDDLVVETVPLFTKEFLDVTTLASDPVVGGGEQVVLRYTIQNTSTSSTATNIAFGDELTRILPFPLSVTLPSTPCGASSSISLVSFGTERQGVALTNGDLDIAGTAGDACSFDVTIDIPEGIAQGTFTSTTGEITATVGGSTLTGISASDDLSIVAAPSLLKEFTDDPVEPNGTVNLQFILFHDEFATANATNISFTDTLDNVITGLAATTGQLPLNNVCGTGNGTLTESAGILTFSGATLTPNETCTFNISLDVPAIATPGGHTNTTSTIDATVSGVATTGNKASDDLQIVGLSLTKEFTDDPVNPGSPVTLRFTLTNSSLAPDATDIVFRDDLDDALPGLKATGATPISISACGGTLAGLSGNTVLQFSGGSVLSGATCIIDVTLDVPAGAAPDRYPNATANFSAKFGGPSVLLPNASDELIVAAPANIVLQKSFDDQSPPLGPGQPAPGDTVTLAFTIGYDGLTGASAINFTDDLNAVVSGLSPLGLPIGTCGGTLDESPSGVLDFAGGSLVAGGECTFSVALLVPLTATDGTFTNTTSDITATVGTQQITGDPASDDLTVVDLGSSEGEEAGRGIPVADAGEDQTVECASPSGVEVTLDGTGTTDDNDDPGTLTYTWSEGFDIESNPIVIGSGAVTTVILSPGVHTITLTVEDPSGNTDSDEVIITVVADTTPPVITLVGDNPQVLECSADYTELGATASDDCDGDLTESIVIDASAVDTSTPGSYTVTYDVSDAAGNAATQVTRTVNVVDTTPPVITLSGPATITLECSIDTYVEQGATASDACDADVEVLIGGDTVDPSTPGTYVVTYDATDDSGNEAEQVTRTVNVVDTTPPAIDGITAPTNPVEVNVEINTSAGFTDACDGTHTAEWDWGDGTNDPSADSITEPTATEPGEVTGSHTYTTPGVYTITLKLTDDSTNSSEATFQFVVVYDPDGGFVTGGGWIDSPEGAYVAEPTLTGKANFGFVSKYKNGASVPTGETEFRFKAGNFNFHSSDYDWLVIAGANAKYKGSGTVNNQGDFGFLLTACDIEVNGNCQGENDDTFRIKIWDKDNNDDVVYDNKMGETDDSNAGTVLAGGNIKIHKGSNSSIVADFSGDVNSDGVMNATDLVQTIGYILGIEIPTDEQFKAADLNHDGYLNVSDLVVMINMVLGIE